MDPITQDVNVGMMNRRDMIAKIIHNPIKLICSSCFEEAIECYVCGEKFVLDDEIICEGRWHRCEGCKKDKEMKGKYQWEEEVRGDYDGCR